MKRMKRSTLCVALALLLCMTAVAPTFADSNAGTPDRAGVMPIFGLSHKTDSTYRAWATILNPSGESVTAILMLYGPGDQLIGATAKTSTSTTINLSKTAVLSSGTYRVVLNYVASSSSQTLSHTYNI